MWDNLISSDKLVAAPETNSTIGVWTDYCELLCLVSDNQEIDHDQLCSIIIKSYDFADSDERKQKNKKDYLTSIIQDVYSHIELRSELLLDKYPFEINADGQLCLKCNTLTHLQKLYILLLCASNLRYMQRTTCLTSDVEVVSLLYMRKLYPTMVFKLFGSSNVNKYLSNEDFISEKKLKDRIIKLADFISVAYEGDIVEQISEHNVGDGGLDIVGIREMGDQRRSIPVMFGQCACSREDWSQKQNSISEMHWGKSLRTWVTSIQKYIFIPIWNMNSDKRFEDEVKISSCIVVDRLRFMHIADDAFLGKCCSFED